MAGSVDRVGIIPFDMRGGDAVVLFVTSRTRGRWILPKGTVEPGESHGETGRREGFEEAGVRGVLLEEFPLHAAITRQTTKGIERIPVTYYPFLVSEQAADWPERHLRRCRWATIDAALGFADRADIVGLIRQFESLVPALAKLADRKRPPDARNDD